VGICGNRWLQFVGSPRGFGFWQCSFRSNVWSYIRSLVLVFLGLVPDVRMVSSNAWSVCFKCSLGRFVAICSLQPSERSSVSAHFCYLRCCRGACRNLVYGMRSNYALERSVSGPGDRDAPGCWFPRRTQGRPLPVCRLWGDRGRDAAPAAFHYHWAAPQPCVSPLGAMGAIKMLTRPINPKESDDACRPKLLQHSPQIGKKARPRYQIHRHPSCESSEGCFV
jgi:hypothetical protein